MIKSSEKYFGGRANRHRKSLNHCINIICIAKTSPYPVKIGTSKSNTMAMLITSEKKKQLNTIAGIIIVEVTKPVRLTRGEEKQSQFLTVVYL